MIKQISNMTSTTSSVDVLKIEKHTIRRRNTRDNTSSYNPVLTYSKEICKINSQTKSIPMTNLDIVYNGKYEPDHYQKSFGNCCYLRNARHDSVWMELSHNNQWKEIIDTLEESCISKNEFREHDTEYPDKRRVEYVLPAIAEKIVRGVDFHNRKMRQQRYLSFDRFAYYVSELHYLLGDYRFTSLGTFKYINDDDEGLKRLNGTVKIKQYGSPKHRGKRMCVRMIDPLKTSTYHHHRATYHVMKLNEREHDHIRYCEVDLGPGNHLLTHISTMGREYELRSFPSWSERKEFHLEHQPSIQYVLENNKHWITKYQVQVRADSGREWIGLGMFTGNNDRLTEVVHKLNMGTDDIYARYVRFIPIGYVGSTSFQVGVFGERRSPKKHVVKSTKTATPTVTYSIIYPSNRTYKLLNHKSYSWNRDLSARRRKLMRKEGVHELMKTYNASKHKRGSCNDVLAELLGEYDGYDDDDDDHEEEEEEEKYDGSNDDDWIIIE